MEYTVNGSGTFVRSLWRKNRYEHNMNRIGVRFELNVAES